MIISLSGAMGSGKSTIAQRLADKLNWPRYYMGGIRREAAKKRGLTLEEYNKLGETDPTTDYEVDEVYQKELARREANFIIEGRTAWHFLPQSLKIYLDVDLEVGAKRIFGNLQQKNDRNEAKNLATWQAVKASNEKRIKSDRARYQKYYQIDVYDRKNYDFYLDTTNLDQNQVFQAVYEWVKASLDKRKN
ncbi:MAG: cytidylate kinase family protein [Patescibacteria group bacterium]|jgi:cytidylate kinase